MVTLYVYKFARDFRGYADFVSQPKPTKNKNGMKSSIDAIQAARNNTAKKDYYNPAKFITIAGVSFFVYIKNLCLGRVKFYVYMGIV